MTDDRIRQVRSGVGIFTVTEPGLIEVSGEDAPRWLDGMISNDVKRLAPGPEASGCAALLLTRQGRIVADLQVLARDGAFWLALAREAQADVTARLDRFVIADDVRLEDAGAARVRIGLEGPRAWPLLEALTGSAIQLGPDCGVDVEVDGVPGVVVRFGWSGEPAVQLYVPAEAAPPVEARLRALAPEAVAGDPALLEALRVEAGIPRLGAELSEEVLPPEARLERAVSYTKGCYTGQEVVARLRTRGQVKHLLVGLRLGDRGGPGPDTPLETEEGRRVGEITSVAESPVDGPIALGFVQRPHDAPGTRLRAAGCEVEVAALPFPGSRGGAAGGAPPRDATGGT